MLHYRFSLRNVHAVLSWWGWKVLRQNWTKASERFAWNCASHRTGKPIAKSDAYSLKYSANQILIETFIFQNSGALLKANKRIQLNFNFKQFPNTSINAFRNIENMIFPILWIDEVYEYVFKWKINICILVDIISKVNIFPSVPRAWNLPTTTQRISRTSYWIPKKRSKRGDGWSSVWA